MRKQRLIDANKIKFKGLNKCVCPDLSAQDIIDNAPTVDAASVVHGEWIDYQSKDPSMCRTDGKSVFIQCSECFDMRVRNFATALNYCPNCGAKMSAKKAR